ncbi:hypothetical protein [Amycolatopsis sp. H20-H5]|uniref:hypothetical protein n=1 Tax=Amycolatopsis sp. H20-H5 TaxID=3046309 RepID=UPI002DBE254B|nr:hypothetical protein [Amycolatopsis sp. H20-H5]MEC3975420.1 hypothetical protein [Amycolatopsis sp. H20-H5]
MHRGIWGEDPELLLTNSTHGAIRVARLKELGVPSFTIYRRCGPDGSWQRLLPGVVSLHNGPPSQDQLVAASLLYTGPDAVVTGATACRAHGLRNIAASGQVQLLTPHGRKMRSTEFVVVERTHRLPKPVYRSGFPMAPVSRAVLDTARHMTELRPARALMSECVQRGMVTLEELSVELARGSNRGSAVPRRVLGELTPGSESIAEIDAEHLWRRSGLPVALWNKKLIDQEGRLIAKPDAWFDEVGLAWEIDSRAFHLGPEGYAKTLARNARYAAAGILVLQTLPSRLREEPERVLAELRAAYRAAAARPRPTVAAID